MRDPTVTHHESVADSLEGMRVVSQRGEAFGVVSRVRDDTMYVSLSPNLSDRQLARLGWDRPDQGEYPLDTAVIDHLSDDAVHLSEL